MTAPTFTKEQLEDFEAWRRNEGVFDNDCETVADLAAFALAPMEGKEAAEAERDGERIALSAWHSIFGTTQLTHAKARLDSAEAERDRLAKELAVVTTQLAVEIGVRDRAFSELYEAEDAIREADRILTEAETGEPRESIWRLLRSAKAWRLVQLAVRRTLERAK